MEEYAINQELNSTHDTEQAGENYDYPMLRMAIQNGFDTAGAQRGESVGSRIAGSGSAGDGTSGGAKNGVDDVPVQRMMDVDLSRGPQAQVFGATQGTNSRGEDENAKSAVAANGMAPSGRVSVAVDSTGSTPGRDSVSTTGGQEAEGRTQLYPMGRMQGYFAGDQPGEPSLLDQLTKPLHLDNSAAGSPTEAASLAGGLTSAPVAGQNQKSVAGAGVAGAGNAATTATSPVGQKAEEALNHPAGNAAATSVTTPTNANGSAQQKPAAVKPANEAQPGTGVRPAAKAGAGKTQRKQQAISNAPPPAARVVVERTQDPSQGDVAVRLMASRKGSPAPQQVRKTMSSVNAEMKKLGMDDATLMAYATATMRAETGDMSPRTEGANASNTTKGGQPFDKYQNNKNLGNKEPGDGERFRGRGFIQLTGRANYERMAHDTGLDLVNHPELASQPENAAIIFAHYLKWHEGALRGALAKGDMVAARAVVNGRNHDSFLPNGLDNFLPAYQMAQRQSGVSAALEKNQNLSVADVAKLWTKNDPSGDQSAYLQDMQKRLNIDPNKSYAQLMPQERQRLESDQAAHVRSMVKKEMPNLQAQARVDQAAWQKRQAEKAKAKTSAPRRH